MEIEIFRKFISNNDQGILQAIYKQSSLGKPNEHEKGVNFKSTSFSFSKFILLFECYFAMIWINAINAIADYDL